MTNLQESVDKLFFSIAEQQAYVGNFNIALALLDKINSQDQQLKIYLLKAKIFAQQKKYEQATIFWKKVLKTNPNNIEANNGLKRIKRLQTFLGKLIYPSNKIYLFSFATIFLLLSVIFLFKGQSNNKSLINEKKWVKLNQNIQDLNQKIQRLQQQFQPLSDYMQQAPNLPSNLPGIRKVKKGNVVTLFFEKGLFYSGNDRLLPEAIPLLRSLAFLLKPLKGKTVIEIIGCTNNLPLPHSSKYLNNEDLGLSRATKIIDYLCRYEGFSANNFFATSMPETNPPYPNDSKANRIKNRTVIIKISKKFRLFD